MIVLFALLLSVLLAFGRDIKVGFTAVITREVVPEEELPNLLERVELYLIKKLLERYSGNKSKVASLLGISRNTLESRLKNLK